MDLELRGRTALVTGASQGIGRALARMLAMQGVRVAGAARRTSFIESMAAEVKAAGGERIEAIAVDLYRGGRAREARGRG